MITLIPFYVRNEAVQSRRSVWPRNGRKLSGWENPGRRKLSKRIYTGATLLSSSPHSICCNTTPNTNIGLRMPIANFHLTFPPLCHKEEEKRWRNKKDNLSGSVAEHPVSPYANTSWSNLQTLEPGFDCLTVLPHAGSQAVVGCGSVSKVNKKFAEKLILKPDTAAGFMAETMNVTWRPELQIDISHKQEEALAIILKQYRHYDMLA